MSMDLSFSQLLAVMAQVERHALSGGLIILRPEAATRLIFDRGVLLHAEMIRPRGRITKGPSVLDALIGRHQGTLEWEWPDELEVAPLATVTPKDTSIFRRALKMLVRYGYFDDPQATPVAAEFFGVSEAALLEAKFAPAPVAPALKSSPSVHSGATATVEAPVTVITEVETGEEADEEIVKTRVKERSGSRSVIANPQTALGKFVFNKALRIGAHAHDDEANEKA